MTGIRRILLAGLTAGTVTAVSYAQPPVQLGEVKAGKPVVDSDPTARAAPPNYDRYFDDNRPAGGQASTPASSTQSQSFMSRAWNGMKNWAGDASNSLNDPKSVDQNLMPLSPGAMPQFQQGGRGTVPPANQPQAGRFGQASGPQTRTGFRPQQPQPANASGNRFGGAPVMAGPNGTGQAPQTMAGKPAYHWYGWGSTMPGRTPLPPQNPTNVSPNWLMQTGATPGAFPLTGVPAGAAVAGPESATIPTPAATMTSAPVTLPSPTTITPPPISTVPTTTTNTTSTAPIPAPSSPALTPLPTITPPPAPIYSPTPTNPVLYPSFPPAKPAVSDEPEWTPAARKPIIEQTGGRMPASSGVIHAVALETEEPTWQQAKLPTPKLIPVPVEAKPVPAPAPSTPPKPALPDLSGGGLPAPIPTVVVPTNLAPGHEWSPVMASQPARTVATAPVTTAAVPQPQTQPQPIPTQTNPFPTPRPQLPATQTPVRQAGINPVSPPPDAPAPREIVITTPQHLLQLENQIGQACMKCATVLDVNEVAPQRLKVFLACKTEAAAREAAAEIAKIQALRPYTVDFEVRLSGK